MAQNFKETAHLNTDRKKYESNYDKIFNNKKEEKAMKPSDLKKGFVTSIRVNEEISDMLRDQGLSPQKILDDKINELFYLEIKNGEVVIVDPVLGENL